MNSFPTDSLSIGTPDIESAKSFLSNNNWPGGLRAAFAESVLKIPIRFYIVDDSGSMMTNDGRRIVKDGATSRFVSCTRWSELIQSMEFVATLASVSKAPTEFRLLNNSPGPICVGFEGDRNNIGILKAREAFSSSPNGGTPLCRHVNEVVTQLIGLAPQLRANNQKAVLVIATDGESSDGDVAVALRPIKDLPVQLIIRLCTNEEKIVNYWNKIDKDLELNMDVLDDMQGEAEEVHQYNKWLTYAEPLHLLRVFGVHLHEFDLLDERKLSSDEMRNIVTALIMPLEGSHAILPHPEVDWNGFLRRLTSEPAMNQSQYKVWCPYTKRYDYWIKLRELKDAYNPNRGSSGCILL